ncbi:MAG TPA: hypothetical protein VF089_03695 [Candidatus Binatia bacterium]
MFIKAIALVAIILFAPAPSLAQNSGSVTSLETFNLADIADDSIVVLSKSESGVPGVAHVKYVYVNSICSGGLQLVDYYGGEFDANDRRLRRDEGQRCSRESHDTGGDED